MATTLLVVNLPMLALYIIMMKDSLEREFDARNQAILTTNAATLSKPLWDFDYDNLPKWTETMLLETTIEEVTIFDDQDKEITSVSAGAIHQGFDHEEHAVLTTDIIHEVEGKKNKVGRIEVHFSKDGIIESIWLVVGKSLVLLTVSIGAIFVTALVGNRFLITRPLGALMNAIDATHNTGQKHLVDVKTNDEIGHVSTRFNELQERLETESDRIQQAYDRLNDLHNHTPALFYSLDEEGRIRAISDYWLAATGYFEEEVIGRNFIEFISEDGKDAYFSKKSHLELQPGELAEATCSFLKRNGSTMDVLIRETVDQDTLTHELLSVSVMTDITNLKQAEETLRVQAQTDSLTGLLNRDGFTNVIQRCLEQSRQEGSQTALIFLDLDRFKWVNDNLGHGAGDELLQSVAHRINMVTHENEFVGRFGGDEFAVVVQGHNASERIVEISKAIMKAVGEAIFLRGREFKVDVSIGVSAFPDHADDALELIKAADVAMYHRKNCGRNGFTVFNHRLGQHAGQFLEYEQLINQALANDWFELHLQPIIDIEQDRMAGMEALLRLNHPERGLIPPSEIIATAEKSSQILDIGDRVIELAMRHLAEFKTIPHLKHCYLTANFSAAQFLPGLPAKLASKFMQYELQPEKFVLEITESVLMQETENLVDIFDAIEELGCCFALDDFGTGYSSLKYLNKFPVSILKIDRSFVQMMAKECANECEKSKTQTLVQGIVAMSHELDLQVVVEGIETEEDADRILEIGADKAQGYYFSRPVSLEQLKSDANAAALDLQAS